MSVKGKLSFAAAKLAVLVVQTEMLTVPEGLVEAGRANPLKLLAAQQLQAAGSGIDPVLALIKH